MGLTRNLLLAGSESRWLRSQASGLWFVRKAVARFVPGERLEDALAAAADLGTQGIAALLTELGENVADTAEAHDVTQHYLDALAKIGASELDCQISVKLTQLGLDVDEAECNANLLGLVKCAQQHGTFVWIDMEQHTYVDATLKMYRRVLSECPNVGVCLQAYLYRTPDDLASLVPLGGGVRLVKGAYREPASVAYPRRQDVDDQFLRLAEVLIAPDARAAGLRAVFGTHDQSLIRSIERHASRMAVPGDAWEFALLYGIQRAEQVRLAREGYRVRVLISYGTEWFPWYMRRLAERPANVWFVVKSLVSG